MVPALDGKYHGDGGFQVLLNSVLMYANDPKIKGYVILVVQMPVSNTIQKVCVYPLQNSKKITLVTEQVFFF